jgi:hypothetical protein
MAMDVRARTVRAVLRAVREVSGPLYNQLLAKAGWARFQGDELPPESDDLIATRDELETLFANVYGMVGEGPTRLFLRNYGQLLATQIMDSTLGRARAQEATTIPPDQRVRWFANSMALMSERSWTPTTLTEDDTAFYLTYERCPLCAGAQGATVPLCTAMDPMYSNLAKQLIGQRLRVAELECAAMGAAHCKVAIYKP